MIKFEKIAYAFILQLINHELFDGTFATQKVEIQLSRLRKLRMHSNYWNVSIMNSLMGHLQRRKTLRMLW